MTDLALDTDLTGEQREYLEMVKSSAAGLLTVLNDILDFSKIERQQLDLETIPFSLRSVLADLLNPLAFRAEQKGLEVICHVLPDVPGVTLGDPGRLRQVLVNLVGNAIKFTERGQILVEVGVASLQDDAVVVRCSVADSGIGIPKDKQQSVFEAFRQADGSTTRQYGGTGLGLAISSRLVELMGGRLSVESEPHEGSIFHFTIRLGLSDARPEVLTSDHSGVRAPIVDDNPISRRVPMVPAQRVRILLAEDNMVNQRVASGVLQKMGHQVTIAANGREALAALERQEFDLVLMDLQMPDMDGFEATGLIRQREAARGGHVPVVAMTAYAMKGDRERCLAAGMDDHLCKPLDTKLLLALINSLPVGRTRAAEPVAS